jgi:hypothetical protein
MDRFFQVFVSSTFDDLKDERSQVSNALAKAGYVAAGMELFPASDQQQLEYIKRIIDRSDYYVVIVGGRYGSLADNELSYTENEFDYARSKGIPTLAFVPANPGSIPVGKSEADAAKREKLECFKEKLKGRMVDHWADTHDLCLKVVTAVAHAINLTPRPGWIRGDQAIDPKVLQEMEKLRIENQGLRERLSTIDAGEVSFDPRYAGPDEFIELKYQISAPQPSTPRYFDSKMRLGDIFVASYDTLQNTPLEQQVSTEVGRMLAKLAGTAKEGESLMLTNLSLQKLRIQLEALGLIDIISNTTGTGIAFGYIRMWKATEKGKRYALSKLAILKPKRAAPAEP